MRESWIIVCAFVIACSPGLDWKPSKAGEIFRYTVVGRVPRDSIVLGHGWTSAAKYGAQLGDTLTLLPLGTFGGADAIAVHRKVNGIVTQVEFAYHASSDVRALVNSYRSSLGQPFAIAVDTVDHATVTTTRWRDASTEFVLITMTPTDKDGIGAFAQLIDRRTQQKDGAPYEK
jgi:hypothetical protein